MLLQASSRRESGMPITMSPKRWLVSVGLFRGNIYGVPVRKRVTFAKRVRKLVQ